VTLRLRWTEQATLQLGAIAEHISLSSPIYAEQTVDRLVRRFDQACRFPQSGRMVPEFEQPEIRELIEPSYRLMYRIREDAIEVLAILHGRQDLGSPR
jgi:plasmid stabilization system protein ParE